MMHRRLNPEQSYLVSGSNSSLQIDSLIHVGFKAGNPTAHANKNLGVRTCSKFTHNIRVHSWYEEYHNPISCLEEVHREQTPSYLAQVCCDHQPAEVRLENITIQILAHRMSDSELFSARHSTDN
jgi:hypothetical protein